MNQDMIDALNRYQQRQDRHPYTCGNDSSHRVLLATSSGWICEDCEYRQPWRESDEFLFEMSKLKEDEIMIDLTSLDPLACAARVESFGFREDSDVGRLVAAVRNAPRWHDKPTCSGLWLLKWSTKEPHVSCEMVTQAMLDTMTWVCVKAAFGPIRERTA